MDRSPDERVREAVQNRLLDNPMTAEAAIEVVVLNGQVSLLGIVDSPRVKEVAESEARSVSGVTTVVTEIEVHQDTDREAEIDPTTVARLPIIPRTNQ